MKELIGKRFVLNSKEVKEGDVFVAVKGKKFDGHDFISEAIENGAYAVISEKPIRSDRVILVDNVVETLAELAQEKLDQYPNKTIVGITGSNGKTTTKEFLFHLLKEKRKVFKTPGNMNTEYGVPLAILNEYNGEEVLILEMAANKKGDIAHLCKIAPPDVPVLLNVGSAHLEFFGNRENIMETKLEIVRYSKEDAVAVTLFDDHELKERVSSYRKALFFGTNGGDVILKDWWYHEKSTIAEYEAFDSLFTIKLPGYWNRGQLLNLAASLCVLELLNDDVSILDLTTLKPVTGRFNVREIQGIWIIDDTYNASLESFQIAIESLLKFSGNKFAVVGSMKELGEKSKELHEELGKLLDHLNGVYVFLTEPEAKWIKTKKKILETENPDEIASDLVTRVKKGDVVLFKASRAVGIEKVLSSFERELGNL
ncbi:UDP-N-acetylmuramoyl-tripeptide--D-alanyl-D-alanine ligase [Thermotoga sp. KOL6]|uniref:UDP-N-acetylmuramoyl-tripeptide--D-alanyl-D- alanine ligase n=1 Tax=Thermotoga sp. KOL6 TaxID=126741 RepID=UPI000C7680AF|nr:UDP-N-acetylmuramoyl-tripeptide--D-alanyl-D-alanine ligase [Thermotoga sp. KOL6]PLV58991.1 UDP-N-acetylmuramoylalanyl-D-glutamyl-2, 6-diaminopimelate--D-alanyl-D-alanine ligase [Thermotoga sp. KOL6]